MAGRLVDGVLRLSRLPIYGTDASRLLGTMLRRDVYDGGSGYIAGTVTVLGQPASRRVRLFDLRSARLVRETWSADDGSYQFNFIDLNREYLVLSHDHKKVYNAVVADRVTPEPMP